MKTKFEKLSVIGLVVLLISCSQSNDKLESEVMAIHDEIMPKMGEIMDLKGKLNEKLKSLDSTNTSFVSVKTKIDSLNNLLTTSDDQMMDWMEQYNADTLKLIDNKAGEAYLNRQKEMLNEVKIGTLKNIEAAKSYLK